MDHTNPTARFCACPDQGCFVAPAKTSRKGVCHKGNYTCRYIYDIVTTLLWFTNRVPHMYNHSRHRLFSLFKPVPEQWKPEKDDVSLAIGTSTRGHCEYSPHTSQECNFLYRHAAGYPWLLWSKSYKNISTANLSRPLSIHTPKMSLLHSVGLLKTNTVFLERSRTFGSWPYTTSTALKSSHTFSSSMGL